MKTATATARPLHAINSAWYLELNICLLLLLHICSKGHRGNTLARLPHSLIH